MIALILICEPLSAVGKSRNTRLLPKIKFHFAPLFFHITLPFSPSLFFLVWHLRLGLIIYYIQPSKEHIVIGACMELIWCRDTVNREKRCLFKGTLKARVSEDLCSVHMWTSLSCMKYICICKPLLRV